MPKFNPVAYLHVGVKLGDLLEFFKSFPDEGEVYLDGDGWAAWGEPVGKNGNDADTLHLIIEVYEGDDPEELLGYFDKQKYVVTAGFYAALTTPENRDKIYAAMTDPDDWTQVYQVFIKD